MPQTIVFGPSHSRACRRGGEAAAEKMDDRSLHRAQREVRPVRDRAVLGTAGGNNPGPVVRLAQTLGCRGFPMSREEIRHQYLASLDAVAMKHSHAAELRGDIVVASIDQDICKLSATRSALDRIDAAAGGRVDLARPLDPGNGGGQLRGRSNHLRPSQPLHRSPGRGRGAGRGNCRPTPGHRR